MQQSASVTSDRQVIVLCADDFGLSAGVSEAIAGLVEHGRLSATGAMTGMAGWRRHGPDLRRLVAQHPADVGLHLTLTGQRPLTAAKGLAQDARLPGIGTLTRRAFAGLLPAGSVRDELRAQLDAFEEVWGAPPDFLDGHQHAHLLPVVRRVVVEELAVRYRAGSVWLRSCTEAPAAVLARGIAVHKAAAIGTLGFGLPAAAARAGIPTNDSFRGLYGFTDTVPYRALFRRFLRGRGRRVLVHCHPGRVDAELRQLDPLLAPREWELAYLASDTCGDDLTEDGVRLGRFRETGA